MYTYMYIYVCVCAHACVCVSVCLKIYARTDICIHAYIHNCTYVVEKKSVLYVVMCLCIVCLLALVIRLVESAMGIQSRWLSFPYSCSHVCTSQESTVMQKP